MVGPERQRAVGSVSGPYASSAVIEEAITACRAELDDVRYWH